MLSVAGIVIAIVFGILLVTPMAIATGSMIYNLHDITNKRKREIERMDILTDMSSSLAPTTRVGRDTVLPS